MTSSTAASALRVTVTARQPMSLGVAAEVSYFTDSHPYVPGSVLRGALAAAWISEYGPPVAGSPDIPTFRQLFDGDIRFGPLHPIGSYRIPLSVLRCKYPLDEQCAGTFVDQALETTTDCPNCGQRLEGSKGELDLPPAAALQRTVRTSIDPATMRAKEGELYAHAALPAGTTLSGTVFGRDPWLEQPRTLRLGGRRSVGGAADYAVTPVPTPPTLPNGPTLILRLISPTVFVDIAGRPRLDPDPVLDLSDDVRVDTSWVRRSVHSGWHAASRLPKPNDMCAMPGSTYRLEGEPATLAAFAERVLRDGVGLRRVEGFGVAEIVTEAWRPPTPHAQGVPAQPSPSLAQQRWQALLALNLALQEQAWLVGALRGLQIELHRHPGAQTRPVSVDPVLDELLTQPTAADLSGRQREAIRNALADLDPTALRDLTTLVISSSGRTAGGTDEGAST